MTAPLEPAFSAFSDLKLISFGDLADVAVDVARIEAQTGKPAIVLCDVSGRAVDLDLRGSEDEIRARALKHPMAAVQPEASRQGIPEETQRKPALKRGRGRPALGVIAREVTLLPRHWQWLDAQGRNVSATLRRLIDEARKQEDSAGAKRQRARDVAYRALSTLAGDLPEFEEASRALFAADAEAFDQRIAGWPEDLRAYALRMATPGLIAPGSADA